MNFRLIKIHAVNFSTLNNEIKKIITYRKDNGACMPIDSYFNDKENIAHDIINKQ